LNPQSTTCLFSMAVTACRMDSAHCRLKWSKSAKTQDATIHI
jgi:hypothetical protein